ncbi:MAG: ribosome biogenesis GTPase Der [Patescibacteria group bacterium]|jgi:GTP-binding protein
MNTKIKPIINDLPKVVLFGRTNVGKSTLFNKLTGKGHAMVSKISGTTRDSNTGPVEWQKNKFQLIDTGGILNARFLSGKSKLKKINFDKDDINNLVQLQVKKNLNQADLILFLVDAREGMMQQDKEMAILLKRLAGEKIPILLVANKADNLKNRQNTAEFFQLALGQPMPVSAATGSGTGDLLDLVCKKIHPEKSPEESKKEEYEKIRIIIIGKPNTGKSTLLNAIIGEDKIITSNIPHTTREPNEIKVSYNNYELTFIDTAGIIKAKSKATKQEFVKSGIDKSLAVLKSADIAIFMLDITEEISHQETKIADEILTDNVNLIITANKWDEIEDKDVKKFTHYINSKFPFMQWAPIVFISAKHKTKISNLMELIIAGWEARNKKIEPADLEKFLESARAHAAPLSNKKIRGIMKHKLPKPKLIKLEQTYINPQEFTLIIKSKLGLKDNYIKYLENRLREKFNLAGTPIRIIVKNKA